MDALTVGAVAAAVAAVVGFFLGRKTRQTSSGSSGGAPARSASSSEADAASRLALSRIGAYLRENVDGPLAAAFKDRSRSLRRAAEDAVAAIDDLHFFLEDPAGEIGEDDLTRIVKEAVQAYESEWDISVLFSSRGSVQVRVNTEALLEALYLVLHNAAVFGNGQGMVATVSSEGEWGRRAHPGCGSGFLCRGVVQGRTMPFTPRLREAWGLGSRMPGGRWSFRAVGSICGTIPTGVPRWRFRFPWRNGRAVALILREGSSVLESRVILGLGTLVRILALAYLGYVALLFVLQRSLLFPGTRLASPHALDSAPHGVEQVWLGTSFGAR